MLVIRAARPSDREGLTAVIARAAVEARQLFQERRSARGDWDSARRRAQELVAILDGELVGRASCTVKEDRLEILDMDVLPEYRRLGIARQFVKVLTETARKVGLHRLSIQTVKEMGTVLILRQLGFHEVTDGPTVPASGNDPNELTEVYMERDVADESDIMET
jgi:N-acetylglutamate synthase-like GNAT family acetyltransferase